MAITRFTGNVNNVGSLPDKPTIDPTELKKVFDQAGIDIKAYLNEVLAEEIDAIENKLTNAITDKLSKEGGNITGDLTVLGNIRGNLAGNVNGELIGKWEGYEQDINSANTENTELLIKNGNKIQHRDITNIISFYGLKKITTGTSTPSGGNDGDVYIQTF